MKRIRQWRTVAKATVVKATVASGLVAGSILVAGGPSSAAVASTPGVLNYATPNELTTFNPYLATAAVDDIYLFPVYETLVELTPTGTLAPGLAKSWTLKDNNTVWEFNLRPGLTFQDGTPLNAQAVATDIHYEQTTTASVTASLLTPVTAVNVVNDTTIDFTVTSSGVSLPYTLADKSGMIVSPAALGNPTNLATHPVGAGAFSVTQYVSGQSATYVPFKNYWNAKNVHLKKLTITSIPDEQSRLTSFESGASNAGIVLPNDVAAIKRNEFTILPYAGVGMIQIALNRSKAPFNNLKVRQALNFAVNRDQLVSALQFGYAKANAQSFPPGYWAYNTKYANYYTYNVKKAKQLLKAAGYPHGFSFTSFVLDQTADEQAAQAVQGMFSKIGVTMSILPVDETGTTQFATQQLQPASLSGWAGRPYPGQTATLLWSGTSNMEPEVPPPASTAALITKAAEAVTPAEQHKAYQALSANVLTQALDIPLFSQTPSGGPWALAPDVKGMKSWVFLPNLSTGITVK
jgi:peptide/nickel transport system substrate-binding protein